MLNLTNNLSRVMRLAVLGISDKVRRWLELTISDSRSREVVLVNEANMRTFLKACGKSGDFIVTNGRLLQKRHQQQR